MDVWTAPAVQEESDYQRSVRVRSCIRPLSAAVWPLKHAFFPRVTHNGFSDRRSRPFRINVFITPAVRERAYISSSSLRRRAPLGSFRRQPRAADYAAARVPPHRVVAQSMTFASMAIEAHALSRREPFLQLD